MLLLDVASRNSIKPDVKDGYYHIYNRGVGKMEIFKGESDYGVFLSYLKEYLSPVPDNESRIRKIYIQDRVFNVIGRVPKNFKDKVVLLCYCLMPNHFHILIKQLENGSMKNFIHSLLLRYSMYFNKKYDRVGPLFQGRYKAVLVENEGYLLYLSKYIHLNPSEFTSDLLDTKSSYADYLKLKHTTWVNPDEILHYFNDKTSPEFSKINNYKSFVENDVKTSNVVEGLMLD